MLEILADTFHTATRSGAKRVEPKQDSDTTRRYPWRRHRWGKRRTDGMQKRHMRGMSDHMLSDIGISRADIDRLFE